MSETPEIADCGAEDKDPDTHDLERDARAALAKATGGEALRRCPFCEAELVLHVEAFWDHPHPRDSCIIGDVIVGNNAIAIAAWNTRAPDPRIAAAKALAEATQWSRVDLAEQIFRQERMYAAARDLVSLMGLCAALLEALEAGDA